MTFWHDTSVFRQILLSNNLRSVLFRRCLNFSTNPTFIGIDLGTTNSCVALLESGKARVIENAEGQKTTPSVVAFTKEHEYPLVGVPAKRQAVTNSQHTVFAAKRLIGRRYEDVLRESPNLPFKFVKSSHGDVKIAVGGKHHSPSEISAYILKEMKAVAERYLGYSVTDAVITVPAYFNDAQRQATKDAGEIAGLTVRRIVNEPTAAALAYGIDKTEDKLIAVYDLGGGTFDISILEIQKGVFEVRATNGDTLLGGEDFDNLLANHIMDKIGRKITQLDPSALQRIKEASENAKIDLSTAVSTTINLPFITTDNSGPVHFTMDLSRDAYESLVGELIKRTIPPCEQALLDGEIIKSSIKEVILVGGMTRMPKVMETVESIFGREPAKGIDPDEAVAIGAAIQAGVLAGEVDEVLLLDVTPLSLGIEMMGGAMSHLISRNTTIPTRVSKVFSTAVDGQTQVEINIFQGERELAHDNKLLGQFVLMDIPPQPRGVPRIEVSFDIDANGILNVSAKDQKTGKEQRHVVNPVGGLTRAEIEEMLETANRSAAADRLRRGLLDTSAAIKFLAKDIEEKIFQFSQQLPPDQVDAMLEFCAEAIERAGDIKEGKEGSLEELKALNKELQDRAIALFDKASKKV